MQKVNNMISKRNILKIIFVYITMLTMTGCFSSGSDDYVLTVDGEKISRAEFDVYFNEQVKSFEEQGGSDIWEVDFDGVAAVNVAKQNAVNTLVVVKAAVSHAEQLGVQLDDNDKAEAKKRAEELITDGADIELLTRIMEESAVQSKVYEKITGSYSINDEEFEEYFNDYYEQNKNQYTKYTVKEIFVQNSDERFSYNDIAEKYNNINSEQGFNALANEIFPDAEISSQEFDESLYSKTVTDKFVSAKKGDYIFAEDDTGYHIFKVEDISVKSPDDVKEEVKQQYINERKQEIYNTQNDTWTASMDIEKNNSVYDVIGIEG